MFSFINSSAFLYFAASPEVVSRLAVETRPQAGITPPEIEAAQLEDGLPPTYNYLAEGYRYLTAYLQPGAMVTAAPVDVAVLSALRRTIGRNRGKLPADLIAALGM
jgi:hypothetical protein